MITLSCAVVTGCTASESAVEPPKDKIFYPTGIAVAPNDAVLFVASANSNLQYDSGVVSVLDLSVVDSVVAGWTASQTIPASCSQDSDHREMLDCTTASDFMVPGAATRVGNFATNIAVQDRQMGNLRLIVPTRGDPAIAWVDWDATAGRLTCNANGNAFALCDGDHRLSYVHGDPNLLMPEEPYDAFADSASQFAIVTHLTTGAVTLIDSPADGNAVIADVAQEVFLPDPLTGIRGATGVAGRTPGSSGDIVYVSSRSENRIQEFTVGRPVNGVDPFLIAGNYFFLDAFGTNAGASGDARGMAFSPSGDRLYVIDRKPASLQVLDTSLGPDGFPVDHATGGTPLCRTSSRLVVIDAGDGERVYTTCFDDGQVYAVDPSGLGSVAAIIEVGRGPYAIAAAPTRKKLYVTNFLEDTVSVIDVAPGSTTRDRVVLKIGTVRPPGT